MDGKNKFKTAYDGTEILNKGYKAVKLILYSLNKIVNMFFENSGLKSPLTIMTLSQYEGFN